MSTRPRRSLRQLARAALAAAALAAGAAQAQVPLPLPLPSTTPPPEAAPATDPGVEEARALISILRDDAGRSRLIEQLETIVAEGEAAADVPAGAEASAGAAPPASPVPPAAATPGSIGERVIAGLEAGAQSAVTSLGSGAAAIRANSRRLRGLADIEADEAGAMLARLAAPVAASLGALALGQLLLVPVRRRLARAASARGPVRRAVLALLGILADGAVVLAATAAGFIALVRAGFDFDAQSPPLQAAVELAYLGSFFVTGMLLVALRAIFSPAAATLRPLPMGDATARYWMRRIGAVTLIVTFAEGFVRAAVGALANPITAHGTALALFTVALVYLIAIVLANRREPVRHFEALATEREDDLWLALVSSAARYWHLVVAGSLLLILHQALTAGAEGVPLLWALAKIAAALAVVSAAIGLLDRIAERGVHLSERLQRAAPDLRGRLNAFVPAFVRALRYVLALAWAGYALQTAGILQLRDWAADRFGLDIVGAIASLLVIALVSFLVWLLVVTWIDYRLTDRGTRIATARERTLFTLLRNLVAVVIIVVAAYYALSEIGVSLAPLLASAGVIGLAISWGSQKLVQDVITGLFIQFENAINVGDVVEAGGKIGVVEKLTIRSMSLRDVEGVYHLIPFSSVDLVSNHMKGFSYHVADVSVAYDADIDAAKEEMLAAYDDLATDMECGTKLLGGVEWFGVQALANSAVMLRVRLKTRPGEQWAVGRAYAERVKRRFDARGIEIPFPQMKLWFGPQGQGSPAASDAGPGRQTRAAAGPTDADAEPDSVPGPDGNTGEAR